MNMTDPKAANTEEGKIEREAGKGAQVCVEDTQTFPEAWYAILWPLQGPVRECLSGSHALLLGLTISSENHVLLYAYVGPPCPRVHRACVWKCSSFSTVWKTEVGPAVTY